MNESLLFALNNAGRDSEQIALAIDLVGRWLIVAIVIAVPFVEFLLGGRRWRTIAIALVAAAFAASLSAAIAFLFPVPRPFFTHADAIIPFFPVMNPLGAFPSGHTAFVMALGAALLFERRMIGLIYVLFALMIGVARVAAGVHYPLDVFGGLLLGILTAFVVVRFGAWFSEETKFAPPLVPMR